MTSEEPIEEKNDERAISAVCKEPRIEFKAWPDEKYFIGE